jgi:hypothetical protein
MKNPVRKFTTVAAVAMLVFEEIDPHMWCYMWLGFEVQLDEFVEVLFFVYYARF